MSRKKPEKVGAFLNKTAKAVRDKEAVKEQVAHEKEVRALRASLKETEALRKAMHSRMEEVERELDAYAHALSSKRKSRPIKALRPKSVSESVAVALASDWHVEEIVPKETVQGLNSYNPEIAEKRARMYWERVLRLVNMNRQHTKIETLIQWLGGDFITGHIHDEMKETTAMSPLEAIDFAARLLRTGLEFLLEHGKFKKIVCPTSFGNHGRLTKKPYSTKAAEHNVEWFMYRQLIQHFKGEERLEFRVTKSRMNEDMVVFGRRLRFHHGEDLKFQGGLQGVYGRLHKAHQAWNQTTPCYMTSVGHWHQAKAFQDLGMMNGSLIGYSAYSQMLQAQFEPPRQMMCLIEKDHGMTMAAPVFVS
jgi:hypothetical protein